MTRMVSDSGRLRSCAGLEGTEAGQRRRSDCEDCAGEVAAWFLRCLGIDRLTQPSPGNFVLFSGVLIFEVNW